MTVPSSALVPVMSVCHFDVTEVKFLVTLSDLELFKNIRELLVDEKSPECFSPMSPEVSIEMIKTKNFNASFEHQSLMTGKTLETLDFSDDVTEEILEPEKESKDVPKQFTFSVQVNCPKIILGLKVEENDVHVTTSGVHFSFEDQQKHRQFRYFTSNLCGWNNEMIILTTDGRGCVPSLGPKVPLSFRKDTGKPVTKKVRTSVFDPGRIRFENSIFL